MYPLTFHPIHKKMIWGSESWHISCRPAEMSIIENGPAAGISLENYIAGNPAAVLGTEAKERFPILVKTINAQEKLSVQVHPDDAYALSKGESDSGKNELWYIIEPPHDEHLVVGFKSGVSMEQLTEAIRIGNIEHYLNRLKVKAGDIINIPAGLVHALTPGAVVAEIQQNSDITYRLYDYNRIGTNGKPRPLHIEDALSVLNFENETQKYHFDIEKYVLNERICKNSNPQAFSVFTCVKGQAVFETPMFTVELPVMRSIFIPAAMGAYSISPKDRYTVLIKSSVK